MRVLHMRKLIAIFLIFIVSLSGCSSDHIELTKEETAEVPDVETSEDLPVSEIAEVPSFEVRDTLRNTKEHAVHETLQDLIPIQGEEELDMFMLEEDGSMRFPSGSIKEVSYSLPGYKKVVIDKEVFKENIIKVFHFLSEAKIKTDETPDSPMDGAEIMIDYIHNDLTTQVKLLSFYDNKTVLVSFNTENMDYDSKVITSEELCEIVHLLSGWRIFDVENLKEIDSMTIQVTGGVQASDKVITISGEKARALLDRMIQSAKVIDCNKASFHIHVKMYKGEVLTYNAYLSGDGSPSIGIETQAFEIETDVVQEIYEELGYEK